MSGSFGLGLMGSIVLQKQLELVLFPEEQTRSSTFGKRFLSLSTVSKRRPNSSTFSCFKMKIVPLSSRPDWNLEREVGGEPSSSPCFMLGFI